AIGGTGLPWGADRQAARAARGHEIFPGSPRCFHRAQTRPFSASRLDLQAMIPVVEGRLPLLVTVDRESDIDASIRMARDYNIKLIIGGGAEAWMMADKLAAARVPVLTGAMNNIPAGFAALGQRQENPGLLRKAGVGVALIGNPAAGDAAA